MNRSQAMERTQMVAPEIPGYDYGWRFLQGRIASTGSTGACCC